MTATTRPEIEENGSVDGSGEEEDTLGDNDQNQGHLDPNVYREYALLAEYSLVVKQSLDGVYVIPKRADPNEWMGVVFIRKGFYQGGIFRFNLLIPANFPDSTEIPTLEFEQPIYHPFIETDERKLDLKRYFPEGWKPGTHHLYHVLIFLQRAFYKLDGSNPANHSAAKVLESSVERFRERAAESVRRSREVVYDKPASLDPHAIKFTPWDHSVHEPLRQKIFNSAHQDPKTAGTGTNEATLIIDTRTSGLSWVDPEEPSILARQNPAPSHSVNPIEKFL